VIDEAPGLCVFRGHVPIPLQRYFDLFVSPAAVSCIDVVGQPLEPQALFGVDHDVGDLTLIAA